MTRSLKEWIGKTDDAPIPDRVRLRVFLAFGGRCQCGCGRSIRPGDAWQLDHKIALINGGEHREGNLWPLLDEHHREKTNKDLSEKSQIYKKRLAHYGIKKSKRPVMGSKASGWKRKMDGTWEKRQ